MTQHHPTAAAILLALGLAAASTAAGKPATTKTARVGAAPAAALEAGVRTALAGDYRTAVYTLWHDSLPPTATEWVRGPALIALRSTAQTRKASGIRIHMLSGRQRVVSLTLNRSRSEATAVVSEDEVVQPAGRDGRPLGRTLTLTEHGQFVLHRIANTDHFVVWQVRSLS